MMSHVSGRDSVAPHSESRTDLSGNCSYTSTRVCTVQDVQSERLGSVSVRGLTSAGLTRRSIACDEL